MTSSQIILTIISSSLVSTILAVITNWIIHRSSYKNDYYKKILDKRISAYENINHIISKMLIHTKLDNSVIPTVFFSYEYYTEFALLLGTNLDHSFWISNEMANKLTEINVYLINNVENKIDNTKNTNDLDTEYQNIGIIQFEQFRIFRKELQKIMNNDFKRLHKLNSFFKSKEDTKNTFGVKF